MNATSEEPHLSGYQARDREVVDYRMYQLAGTGLQFRGPPPAELDSGNFFSCIGAAQTLGCFCPHPFPDLLTAETGLQSLNLGYGGAGPEFFADQEALIRVINRGRFAVIQVMSGRSQSNSAFECGGLEYLVRRSDKKRMGANEAYRELLAGPAFFRRLAPGRLGRGLARMVALPKARRLVAETRRAWIDSHRRLLAKIEVPTVLFWFSKRAADYPRSFRNVGALFGDFPQLVDKAMIAEARLLCDHYIECVSSRGSPQPLFSRYTGRPVTVDPARDRPDLGGRAPWTHNLYYPSPEMHEDAAAALAATCRLLSVQSKRPPTRRISPTNRAVAASTTVSSRPDPGHDPSRAL